jgi:ABC-type bacteriocin/lantibiotic exporter with double-glycine peptidase domain
MNTVIAVAPRFVVEASGMVLIAGFAVALSRGGGQLAAALPILGALAVGAQRLLPLLQSIYNAWAQIAGSHRLLADVADVLDLPGQPQVPEAPPLAFRDRITFTAVGFRYRENERNILEGINLEFPAGSRVGLVGKTGSGKSTAMDLLLGLLEPSEGRICVDGVPLTPQNIARWQRLVAHVPQAIYLSDASIAENIAFAEARDRIDMDRVKSAARRAALEDFVETLPDGYRTEVGERGVRLSGGQRQRIGIARALYRKASVLVFDEATSALDAATEREVIEAIKSLGHDLTIILIAHRLSTLEICDTIYRIENGKITPQDGRRLNVG